MDGESEQYVLGDDRVFLADHVYVNYSTCVFKPECLHDWLNYICKWITESEVNSDKVISIIQTLKHVKDFKTIMAKLLIKLIMFIPSQT